MLGPQGEGMGEQGASRSCPELSCPQPSSLPPHRSPWRLREARGPARTCLISRCHGLGDTACARRTFTAAREAFLFTQVIAPHNFSFK